LPVPTPFVVLVLKDSMRKNREGNWAVVVFGLRISSSSLGRRWVNHNNQLKRKEKEGEGLN